MSGLEVIGALAATSQLVTQTFKIVEMLLDIRDHLQHLPAQIQCYIDQLEVLAYTIQYIEGNQNLHLSPVKKLLKTISTKVDALYDFLRKSRSRFTQPSLKRFIHVLALRKVEKRINEKFVDLEIDKSNLALYITESSNKTLAEILSDFKRSMARENTYNNPTETAVRIDFTMSNLGSVNNQPSQQPVRYVSQQHVSYASQQHVNYASQQRANNQSRTEGTNYQSTVERGDVFIGNNVSGNGTALIGNSTGRAGHFENNSATNNGFALIGSHSRNSDALRAFTENINGRANPPRGPDAMDTSP